MEGSIHTTKPQKLTIIEKNQEEDPNKFYYHFLYKTAIVLIFFVILPLFPAQAPEFINQNLLTRNWELLHLLFVGIAISYGLFSRRNQNDETEKDNNNSKFDTAQSLVSRFLQVSSFFEDEVETNPSEETKVQTWNNQHYRNKPVVLVHSDFQDNNNTVPDKPLLLPVRSLKSRLSDDDDDDDSKVDKSCTRSFSFDSSRTSKRFSNNLNKARNEEIEEMKENVVLASPIPWRSRSARMEPKLEDDERPSMEESVKSQFRSQSYSRSSTKQMTSRSPPPPPPPPPMVSKESVGKHAEDLLKKKSFYKPSPSPPPPPPPPPPMVSKESVGKKAEGSLKKKSFYKFNPPPPPPPPPTMFQKSIYMKKPPRYGYAERISMAKHDKPIASISREIGKEGIMNDANQMEEEDDEEEHGVPEEEKESFLDTETEDEDDDVGEGRISVHSENGEGTKTDNEASSSSLGTVVVSDEGPDVDKKADEFIAKFREQIRLQRIQSIKNSTTRIARNSSR